MRDRYAFAQLTALPMAATLILHLALIGFVILRWSPDTRARSVEARVLPPRAIVATLIEASAMQPPSTPPPRQAAPKPDPRPATPAAAPAESSVDSTPRRDPEPRASRPVRRPTAARPEPPQARKSAQEWAAIGRAELAAALDREDSVAGAEEMSASYAASIRDTVESYWSAPPSARNGMEALLAIQLVPTGELVSVSVLRSSGSAAFDRSALNAVEKAAAFPELRNLPRREFERRFRRFQLLFRPETLRY